MPLRGTWRDPTDTNDVRSKRKKREMEESPPTCGKASFTEAPQRKPIRWMRLQSPWCPCPFAPFVSARPGGRRESNRLPRFGRCLERTDRKKREGKEGSRQQRVKAEGQGKREELFCFPRETDCLDTGGEPLPPNSWTTGRCGVRRRAVPERASS